MARKQKNNKGTYSPEETSTKKFGKLQAPKKSIQMGLSGDQGPSDFVGVVLRAYDEVSYELENLEKKIIEIDGEIKGYGQDIDRKLNESEFDRILELKKEKKETNYKMEGQAEEYNKLIIKHERTLSVFQKYVEGWLKFPEHMRKYGKIVSQPPYNFTVPTGKFSKESIKLNLSDFVKK